MAFARGESAEARVLVRLLANQPKLLPNAHFWDDQSTGPWQNLFGPELSAQQWQDVVQRLVDIRLVWSDGAAGHVGYGLTPHGVQVALANRDKLPIERVGSLGGRVFLSHSYKDNSFCRELDTRLKQYGFQTWFDLDDLPAGNSIPEKIDYGMRNSRSVVLIYTHSSAASRWVNLEINVAVTLETNRELKHFVVIRLDDAKLPPILAHKAYITFPRDEHDTEYQPALNKLIAGLLAV